MVTCTTVGYGDIAPESNAEKAFCSVALLFSAIMYGTIFGNMSLLIQSFEAQQRRYLDQRERIREFARLYQLPAPMHRRMQLYAKELFTLNKGLDLHGVSRAIALPPAAALRGRI